MRVKKPRFDLYSGSALASTLAAGAVVVLSGSSGAAPADTTRADLEKRFAVTVKPFLTTYCLACHGKDKPAAQFDLSAYGTVASVVKDDAHWALTMGRIAAKEMPPAGGKQPTARERDAILGWIRAVRRYEASRNAGDPGPVLAHRLSNAEYDYTIRDLTGVDLHPAREFPVDPANQEGFVKGTGLSKYIGSVNGQTKLLDKAKVKFNIFHTKKHTAKVLKICRDAFLRSKRRSV